MKKTAAVVLTILVLLAGAACWLWFQAIRLPGWYTESEKDRGGTVIVYGKGTPDIRRSLEQALEARVPRAPVGAAGQELTLTEDEANRLFAIILSENAKKYLFLKAVKASTVRIRDGKIDLDVVMDTSEILKDASVRIVAVDLLSGLLKSREVSLGFTGVMEMKDGRLQLDEDGRIRFGGLSFSLKTIMKRWGISSDELRKTVSQIQVGKFKIDQMEPIRDILRVRAAVSPAL